MKITKVTPIFCDAGWRAFTFVKVETDEGLVGYGECTDNRSTFGIAGCVRDLEPRLIGQNPMMVEKLYTEMSIQFLQNLGGIGQKAIAGIEVALWDIKAKALDVPLYELFGGPLYVVSESGTMWAFEVTNTLEATALLPGGSIIVPSYL